MSIFRAVARFLCWERSFWHWTTALVGTPDTPYDWVQTSVLPYDRTGTAWYCLNLDDGCPPGGESFKQVASRALPFYKQHILLNLMMGKNSIIVSHHNVLRSLAVHINGLDIWQEERIERMPNGSIFVYKAEVAYSERKVLISFSEGAQMVHIPQ